MSCPNCPGPRVPHHCGKLPTLKEQIAALAIASRRRPRGVPVAACPKPAIYQHWARSSSSATGVPEELPFVAASAWRPVPKTSEAHVSAAALVEATSEDAACSLSVFPEVHDEQRVAAGSKTEADSTSDHAIQFGSFGQAVCAAVLEDVVAGSCATETDSTRDDETSMFGSVAELEEPRCEEARGSDVSAVASRELVAEHSTVVSEDKGQVAKQASATAASSKAPIRSRAGVCPNCPGPTVPHRCGKEATFTDQLRALKTGKVLKGMTASGPRPF